MPNPSLPAPLVTIGDEKLFTLYYRQGMNPHPVTKTFKFTGDFRAAIQRAKSHCELMNLRFVHVTPFMADLDADEKRLQESV